MEDVLKLSVYAGERDRAEGRLLSDALMDLYARHGVHWSVLLRGLEGFGIKHRLAAERLLTLSEDLPLLAVALDRPERIEALVREVQGLTRHGLITLERASMLGADIELEPSESAGELKLTVHLGRGERAGGGAAYLAVVDCLRRHGLGGASVLLGLDGTSDGARQRARFMASNGEVPLMVVSVGAVSAIASALPELGAMLARPAMTLERVSVCKRDGVLLAPPAPLPAEEPGLAQWRKLVIYASERSRYGPEPLHSALVKRLRAEGAAGATVLRGIWGFHGEHRPHGERFWSLARHVPVLTMVLDTPANMVRWFEIVDELTRETGLVTSEIVPALRASAPGVVHGGLDLSAKQPDAF
jgi:PII-like signaling protein